MTMKQTILTNTTPQFLYEDLEQLLPGHAKHSIMGRVHELIADGSIARTRRASNGGKTKAIYQKLV